MRSISMPELEIREIILQSALQDPKSYACEYHWRKSFSLVLAMRRVQRRKIRRREVRWTAA